MPAPDSSGSNSEEPELTDVCAAFDPVFISRLKLEEQNSPLRHSRCANTRARVLTTTAFGSNDANAEPLRPRSAAFF